MIVLPLLRLGVFSNLNQIRNIRPTIKIGKEKFQLTINVHQFSKDEIRVKARPEYVIIEGKQERRTKRGYVIRQFARKFKLPHGCHPEWMRSTLSPEGILTITAPRDCCDVNLPCETAVPISYSGKPASDESLVDIPTRPDVCRKLLGDDKKDQK